MDFAKLTVHHYGETEAEDRRITIGPMNVVAVAAAIEDVTVRERQLRLVTVLFMDSGNLDLLINHSDLELLEGAIGSFCLG